jgi:hypothetical protein
MLTTTMTTAMTAVTNAPFEPAPWVTPILAILAIIFGTGGIATIAKARADRKNGVAAAETAEDDSVSERWRKIIEAQTESLVGPLQKRLSEVETKVQTLEQELIETRAKYWKAVKYIRTLLTWIARNGPQTDTELPTPPAEVVEDI